MLYYKSVKMDQKLFGDGLEGVDQQQYEDIYNQHYLDMAQEQMMHGGRDEATIIHIE